jgi:growth arrest-specific protein 8
MAKKGGKAAAGGALTAEEEAIRKAKGTDDIMDEDYIRSLRLECRDL